MSANNWDLCPKCLAKAEADRSQAIESAAAAYGRIPTDEWRAVSEAAYKKVDLEQSMREDYEIGMRNNGTFFVGYSARCMECGFTFDYCHEQSAMDEQEPTK